MQSRRSISASMVRPHKAHSPKITSSPAAADTLSALLEDLGAEPRDFDCIVTGDLGHIGADLLLTLLRGDSIDLSPVYSDCGSLISATSRTRMQVARAAAAQRRFSADRCCAICIAAKSTGWCLRAQVR